METLRSALGGSSLVEEIQMIRGLNRDFEELRCGDGNSESVPCRNVMEAMVRLGLKPQTSSPAQPSGVVLHAPDSTVHPPLLIPKADADATATCSRRCGVFGAILGAALAASIPLEANGHVDPNREVITHAGAAAASVASVALCAKVCEPKKQRAPIAQPGVPFTPASKMGWILETKQWEIVRKCIDWSRFTLTGTYTHKVPDLEAADRFSASLRK